ncbi:MAG: DNA methyltransferase [Deltaproteobacteria bacterium]|nr:DNA methyltransferase [Deltaproteobacteria bacterium]
MAKPNFKNRTLYHGDNLDFLRGMNSESVHLIATDPPFNKARDFHATPDSLSAGAKFQDRWNWDKDVHQGWVDQIRDDWPAVWAAIDLAKAIYGKDMAAFLCFMGVRLIEMQRVLREDGSIYLHCDPTASHYLKALMDAIFGKKMFRNEIVWCYSGGGIPKKDYPRKHDVILRYTNSNQRTFNIERKPYAENTQQVGIHSTYSGADNKIDLKRGTPVTDWWNDIQTTTGWSPENTGYPTQKPLALYERIVKASSNSGDWVLDPFCGCATTPLAAERLGRRWVGMDLWERAHEVVLDRLGEERLDTPGKRGGLLPRGEVHYETTPPVRKDDTPPAAPRLETPTRQARESAMSRAEMFNTLIERNGIICAGCNRRFDDPLYLELDHIRPRADGGSNDLDNRTLLCGPCNRIKSNTLTLSGLRRENKKRNRMAQ